MTDPVLIPDFPPDFPPATHEAWRALVDKVLKGADFDEALTARTYDGLTIEPLYAKGAGDLPAARRAAPGPWHIVQRVDHPEPGEANALALADLQGGADGLALVFAGAPGARGYGLGIATLDDLDGALSGVMLDLVHIRIETAPFMGRAVAALMAALMERRGHAPGKLSIDFGLDPIGDMARTGSSPVPWADMAGRLGGVAGALSDLGFRRSLVRVDTRAVHEAGGSQAQELAFAVATGIAYLRALEAHGFTLAAARDGLGFLLVADADQFLTIAKFRAMRRLWARVEEACGLEPKPIRLDAETAWRMTTRRDPVVNMLRGTIAAFAAGLGGADGVAVLPFTAALGLPDAFARRMARNTQLILVEEAHLARVADPAAGAGGFEALTEELTARAWTLVQTIEKAGGMAQCLVEGTFQAEVARVRGEREHAIRHRREAITGTSEFPNISEADVAVLRRPRARPAPPAPSGGHATFEDALAAARQGAALAGLAPRASADGLLIEPLPSRRDAEPFERLRDMSDERLARTGARPKVFLANLGPVAAFTARANFAKNFFEAGGIEAVTNEGFASPAELAEAFRQSGAKLACICSSDDIYEREANGAAKALQQHGVAMIFVVGRPQKLHEPSSHTADIRYIFAGCDVLAALDEAFGLG